MNPSAVPMLHRSARAAFLLAFFASTLIGGSYALSWPLCDGGAVWITESPRTVGRFPGANLMFFCEGNLNIAGSSVAACIPTQNASSLCQPQVADAICQLLGYDGSYAEDTMVGPAAPDEKVVTLNGDYCLRKDVFANSVPEDLESLPGDPCDVIRRLTCIRTLDTMAASNALVLQTQFPVMSSAAAPAAEVSVPPIEALEAREAQRTVPSAP